MSWLRLYNKKVNLTFTSMADAEGR